MDDRSLDGFDSEVTKRRVLALASEVPEDVKVAVVNWWNDAALTAGQVIERVAAVMGMDVQTWGGRTDYTAADAIAGRLDPEKTAEVRPFHPRERS